MDSVYEHFLWDLSLIIKNTYLFWSCYLTKNVPKMENSVFIHYNINIVMDKNSMFSLQKCSVQNIKAQICKLIAFHRSD